MKTKRIEIEVPDYPEAIEIIEKLRVKLINAYRATYPNEQESKERAKPDSAGNGDTRKPNETASSINSSKEGLNDSGTPKKKRGRPPKTDKPTTLSDNGSKL